MGAPVGAGAAASSGNVANAAATAILPAVAGKTNYVSGIQVTAAGATVGLPVIVTLAGVAAGTLSWILSAPAGALIGAAPLALNFDPPLPGALGGAVTLTCPALGVGNTNAAATINGFTI